MKISLIKRCSNKIIDELEESLLEIRHFRLKFFLISFPSNRLIAKVTLSGAR